ncbi:rust resistance kinase Lr10-like [Vitis riparia]|uniref:rust resistance kinase Lr10-like n=1 Tax=Vitis riparia TaxID=96939 RepID=UPI00155A2A92|nr:rust resistance kinase Lr10-like [Vitis riparia]
MSTPLKIVVLLHFFLLVVEIDAENGVSQDQCTVPAKCSPQGPPIRFPFRLKGHPKNCGCPGFELSCTGTTNQTMLELPFPAKLPVEEINYTTREIRVHYEDSCLPPQLMLRLAYTPFKLVDEVPDVELYTFFSCSSDKSESLTQYTCHIFGGTTIYAVRSDDDLGDLDLYSCQRIDSVVILQNNWENAFHLNWTNTICGDFEAEDGKCRPKSNSMKHETECIHKPRKPEKDAPRIPELVAGIILGFLFLGSIAFALYHVYSLDKSQRENRKKIEKFLEDYRALKPSRYSYADIKKITHQFKDKLGQGAYGTVYKGKLSNEVFVAVKILNDSKGNGDEFINEVATMGTIHHVHVVHLVGFCADRFKRALIYEFLPNESLEKFIFPKNGKNHSLGWLKLQDIALGIAKGIEYLHQGCDKRILHFDIKPHNILLDHNFNPKISDFGLAKLCSKEQSVVSMTTARGTIGYIAPEVLSRNFGNITYKSDVYSFGMLLLEMVGGRKNIDVTMEKTGQVYFPEWVYNHLDQGEELHIRIEEEGDAKIAKKLTIVGLWCIQWYPIDRPSMKVVVQMLEREDNLIMPPNPFTATDRNMVKDRMRINTSKPPRPLPEKELEVITELE